MDNKPWASSDPPPAYSEYTTASISAKDPRQQLAGDKPMGRSSRRTTGLFPAPPALPRLEQSQPPDGYSHLVNANISSANSNRPPNSPLGNSDVPPQDNAGSPVSQTSIPLSAHKQPADRHNCSYETGQDRGFASSAIEKGRRLVRESNSLSARPDSSSGDNGVEDVYLAVMGVTGAGKSSFIKLCTNQNVKIGHNLKSCTAFVEDFQIMYNSKVRLHLIDTPGFDDTHKSDTDVLRDIAAWLGTTYRNGILLSGIIYLHRISDPRMSGGAMRNLHMFKALCGKDCFRSVILATTFWNSIDGRQAIRNECELKTTEEFWGEMIAMGSSYTRHTGDKQSAWRILDFMIQRRHPFRATIQQEMVDGKLDLIETKAGKQLSADLIAMEEKHVKKMRELEESYQAAQIEQDQRSMKRIAELHERLQKEIDEGKESQADLVASLERINKERNEELEQYKHVMESRMKEMDELRRQLDTYQDGSREAARQNEEYQKKLKELQENLATVKRRQPGLLERFGDWVDETAKRIEKWWDSL